MEKNYSDILCQAIEIVTSSIVGSISYDKTIECTVVDDSNRKIKQKTKERKKIIEYYQISNGENSYLEYIIYIVIVKYYLWFINQKNSKNINSLK